jgi:hypothetical protein
VGSGAVVGSLDGAGSVDGGGSDGWAAITPTGAIIEKSNRKTCRPITTRRTPRRRREAAEDANTDSTPLS